MNIGEASKASKVSAKMIRYYEQIGLIPPADRTDSGYRAYTQDDVHRLHFIRRARDLGFSVAEITDLLGLWNDKSRQSADVKRLAQQHIAELGDGRDAQGADPLLRRRRTAGLPDPAHAGAARYQRRRARSAHRRRAAPRTWQRGGEKAAFALIGQERHAQDHRLAPS